jgi:hypothetical protein
MAWIKRNLYFVICVVVGLGCTGYCAFLLLGAASANSAARDSYNADTNSLYQLQSKKPYPSKENITAAQADAERVRAFKAEFLKLFAGFPTPPTVDNHEFNDHLKKTIARFGLEATNAGVGLNPDYTYGFSQQMGKLDYPAECLAPWMQELEEMDAILHILYTAKINFLEHIRRPLVSPNDGSDDNTQLNSITNQLGVSTPYTVEFRAFSAELADVLAGFARSSNCFIVKAPFVLKSTVPLPDVTQFQAPSPPPPTVYYRPPPRPINPLESTSPRSGRDMSDRRALRPRPQPTQEIPVVTPGPVQARPVTILSEQPLFVTIYIDVVKLKALETNAPAHTPAPKSRARER